jgi:hypothetical protein
MIGGHNWKEVKENFDVAASLCDGGNSEFS